MAETRPIEPSCVLFESRNGRHDDQGAAGMLMEHDASE
jgi:hypothetical protein